MEKVQFIQWDVEEEQEVQDTALKARQSQLQHSKEDTILNGVGATQPSSFTPDHSSDTSGCGARSNGVFCASVDEEQALIQKVEELEEIFCSDVVENGNHFNGDAVGAVGLGVVVEVVGGETATNGEVIGSVTITVDGSQNNNNNNLYLDKQQGNEFNELTGVQNCNGTRPDLPESHGVGEIDIQEENSYMQNSISEIDNQCMEAIDDKVSSSSELSALQNSSEVLQPEEGSAKEAGAKLIKEIDQKVEEFEEMFANEVENGIHLNVEASEAVGVAARIGDIIDNVTITISGSQNKNNVYFDKQQGNNDFNGLTQVQNGDGVAPVLPISHGVGGIDIQVENSDIQNVLWNGINNQCMKAIDDKVLSSEVQPDEGSVKSGPNLTNEADQKLEEFDVEAVLVKQETHDLFCPNCNSCITKRVILKKRKRKPINKNSDTKEKREKLEAEVVKTSAGEVNQRDDAIATFDAGTTIVQPANNDEPERDAEVFRCLSCFSFFIPLKNGIKLFPNVRGAREPSQTPLIQPASNLENPSSVGGSKENWFISLFTSNGRKKAHGQDGQLADTSLSKNVQPAQDIKSANGIVGSPIPSAVNSVKSESQMKSSINSSDLMNGNVSANVGERKNDSVDMIKTDTVVVADKPLMSFSAAATTTTDIHFNNGKTVKDAILKSYEEPLIHDKSQKDVDKTQDIAQNNHSSLVQEAQSPAQPFGNGVFANGVASDNLSSGVADAAIPSGLGFMKAQNDIEEEINLSVSKDEDKQAALKFPTSRTEVNNIWDEGAIATQSHTQIDIGEEPRAETSEPQEWEIVKSIVYGGLIESITSLGIVSSAISSGAAPLNIVALGLANLIGGLFIIGHDLIELKNDHSEGDPQHANMQQDRYKEQLGRRENFLLHAFVAVLSFLIFGSIPIIVYGLLSNKDYSDQVKVGIVAATSVLCIIVLAIGKAYTRRPTRSYTKTVLQYVTMAVATSGVTYIAGDLLKNVLQKLNRPESGGVVLGMPFSGMEPNWMSY